MDVKFRERAFLVSTTGEIDKTVEIIVAHTVEEAVSAFDRKWGHRLLDSDKLDCMLILENSSEGIAAQQKRYTLQAQTVKSWKVVETY